MSDIVIEFRGDNKDLTRTLKESEKKIKGFADQAKRSGAGFDASLRKSAAEARKFAGIVGGGLGIGAATAGFKAFGAIVEQTMRNAQRQAQIAGAAISNSLNNAVQFTGGGQTFSIDSREQAVELGRFFRQELGRVNADLERNFGSFINSDLFAGGLEKVLQAGALAGIGKDQLNILRTLTLQRDTLQGQVDKYTALEIGLTTNAKAAKLLGDRFGFVSDQAKEAAAAAAKLIAPTPDRPAAFSSSTSGFNTGIGALPGSPGKEFKELFDSSLVTDALKVREAVQAGVIPALQGLRAEAGLVQQQLLFMLEQGVNPSNVAFQEMLGKFKGIQAEGAELAAATGEAAGSFKAVDAIGIAALEGITSGFLNARNAAEGFNGVLRGVGNRLLNLGLNAGLNVAIGGLTGNPLSFGQALGSLVGVGATAAPARLDSPALSAVSQHGGLGLAQQTVSEIRVDGTDLLITLRNAESARNGRGGAI